VYVDKTNSVFEWIKIIGIGIRRTISISNTIKITASRKNRVENGIRAELIGSNPHSNGEVFSRSAEDRILTIKAIVSTIRGIKIHNVEEIISRFMN
jgi:hypothetical protein